MSNFLDNFISGMAFGMFLNNPFFGGMSFMGYGNSYGMVDFGGFANPFPSIFSGGGFYGGNVAQLPPTTFANSSFPTVDFTGVGQAIWDYYTNPDSDYNKMMRDYYETINKMQEQNSSKQEQYNINYQMPFFYPSQTYVQRQNLSDNSLAKADKKTDSKKAEDTKKAAAGDKTKATSSYEPDETDAQLNSNKNKNSAISYDAKKLKDNWSKSQPQLSDQFYSRVVEISKKIKCNPEDLMALMNLETGRTFSPSEKCGKSSATGLIQFTDATAKTLGVKMSKLKKMSAVEQLDYVEKYFIYWKKELGIKDQQLSAGDLYALVAQPGNAKQEVLITSGTKAYRDNAKIWDVNNDKKITKTDLAACLDKFRA